MEALYILIVPFIWFFVAKYWLQHTFNFKEMGISMAIVTILVVVTVQLGKFGQTQDTEVWNGYVTKKERKHGTYEDPYDCFCTTDSKGNTSCQTCYETRYTVSWIASTTVGMLHFKHLDRSSRSVYNEPDPHRYTICKVGEPASREHVYTNYVQAVPQSLFHDDSKINTYAAQVPAYPRVYDFYRFNRVINMAGVNNATVNQIDNGLDNALKLLGAQKQANIIVILTGINDPTYRYAVERAWLGGKKNDIVIFVGVDNTAGNKIQWVDVMTWALNSGNELFHVTMRDGIKAMETLDANKFVPFVSDTVAKLYDRPQMISYEYLADEIEPPTWVIWLAIILAFGGSAGLTWYFHRNEI